MEIIITNTNFLEHLTYFIKMGIYVNKGTDKNQLLEKCVKLYNKYKLVENRSERSKEEEEFIRKTIKRFNLVLKTIDDKPVDIRDKSNQLKILNFKGHPSLYTDNVDELISYGEQHNIDILTDISLSFMLRDSKYQELIWLYCRALFFMSQMIISHTSNVSDSRYVLKKEIYDESLQQLEVILSRITELDEKIKTSNAMMLDTYLSNKLIKSGIDNKKISDAKNEVKQIFNKKGIKTEGTMHKMIDSISEKITQLDLSQGNIVQSMFDVAQNVANEIRSDIESDPEQFKQTLSAITEIFQETMSDASGNSNVPPELKDIFNTVVSASAELSKQDPENVDEETLKKLHQDLSTGYSKLGDYGDTPSEENLQQIQNMLSTLPINLPQLPSHLPSHLPLHLPLLESTPENHFNISVSIASETPIDNLELSTSSSDASRHHIKRINTKKN